MMTDFPPPTKCMSEETAGVLASQFRELREFPYSMPFSHTCVTESLREFEALIELTLISRVLHYTIKVCTASFLTKLYWRKKLKKAQFNYDQFIKQMKQ